MTRTQLAAACTFAILLAFGAAGTASARSSWYFGINTAPAVVAPAYPYYVAPPPPPAPVRTYYYPRYYYAPAPAYYPAGVNFSFGYGGYHHHR